MGSGPVAIAASPVPNAPRGHSRVNRMRDVMTNPDLQLMADEFAIRRVLDEYCLRLEVNAFDEWLDLFTDDTEYHVFRRVLKGRNELSAMLSLAPHGVHVTGDPELPLCPLHRLEVECRLVSPHTGAHGRGLEDCRHQGEDRADRRTG